MVKIESERDGWLVGVLILYGVLAVTLWIAAFMISGEKIQAAMIGAASAFTAGCAAVTGGLFTAARASRLQLNREVLSARREAYSRYAAAMKDEIQAREDRDGWKEAKDKAGLSDTKKDEALEQYIEAAAHARETHLARHRARAAAFIVAGPDVLKWLDAQRGEEVVTSDSADEFVKVAQREVSPTGQTD